MNKLLLPFLGLCLLAWLFGGAYWFGQQFQNEKTATAWHLKDGKHSFSSPTKFSFEISSAEIMLDHNQDQMLLEIVDYLTKSPNRFIELKGFYTSNEINNSDFENLGIGRAEAFRYLMYRQGIDLDRIRVLGHEIKSHQLNGNGQINGGVEFSFIENPLSKYGLNQKITFENDKSTKLQIEDIYEYVAGLRQYMVDYPNKKLNFICYSNSVGQNEISRKRAYLFNKRLQEHQIDADKISFKIVTTNKGSNQDNTISLDLNS